MVLRVLVLLFLSGPPWAVTAEAHPHVWVDMETGVIFNPDGLISGVDLYWAFDKNYTRTALAGLDTNNDGVFSAEELAPLAQVNLEAIKTYHYFTWAEFNGEAMEFATVDPHAAKQLYANGRLALHFTIPFAKPVDPHKGTFVLRIYDPDYYIAFDYVDDNPVMISGKPPANCDSRLGALSGDEELQRKRDYLAGKDQAWKPSPSEEFGSLFARPLIVSCR